MSVELPSKGASSFESASLAASFVECTANDVSVLLILSIDVFICKSI